MRTSALFGAYNFGFFELYGVSARTVCGQKGRGVKFCNVVRTPFMNGPLQFLPIICVLCFNRKKLAAVGSSEDWSKATYCVVKQYMDNVDRKTLYEDVRLQMEAKLWGEEYNKHHPPKKVCLFCCLSTGPQLENIPWWKKYFIVG